MNANWDLFPLTETRFKLDTKRDPNNGAIIYDACQLFFGKRAPGEWRFVIKQRDYRVVGEIYESKEELLSDMNRYAEQWGFLAP